MGRFYSVVNILGGEVLPDAPTVNEITLTGNLEEDAKKMREYLGISVAGPIGNLIQLLENRGILVYACDIENDAFSGMNGALTAIGESYDYMLVKGDKKLTVSVVGCRMRNYVSDQPFTIQNPMARIQAIACIDKEEEFYNNP